MQEDPDGEHQENVLATGMVANSRPRDNMTKTTRPMSDDPALTPREAMEAEKARPLEQAAAVDRDMAELERIVSKYKLVVIAPGSKPAPKRPIPRSDFERAQLEAEAIIRAAGRPIWIDELFPMILQRGVELRGREPSSVLSAYLRRTIICGSCANTDGGSPMSHGPPETNLPASQTISTNKPQEMNGTETFAEIKQRNKDNVARAIEAAREFLKGKSETGALGRDLRSSRFSGPQHSRQATDHVSEPTARQGGWASFSRSTGMDA